MDVRLGLGVVVEEKWCDSRQMIKLSPFTKQDFNTFKDWISDPEELFQFAGPMFSFPISDEQLEEYINMKDRTPLKVVLESTNKSIGHCELNYESGRHRLSRILIGDKTLRGQGIGESVVRQMVNLLFENAKVNEVDLNVFE